MHQPHTSRFSALRGRGQQPVVFMSLNGARAYCQSIDARVPAEAEWEEYAARAGTGTNHFWGEEIHDR